MTISYQSNYMTVPRSRETISIYAQYFKKIIGFSLDDYVDIVDIIENQIPKFDKDFNYEIISDLEEMAYIDVESCTIYIRENIYEEAINGVGYARFTLAHEIGHYLLHRQCDLREKSHPVFPVYMNPEWQAEVFAGELLAPSASLAGMDVEEIMNKYGISSKAAEVQKRFAKSISVIN